MTWGKKWHFAVISFVQSVILHEACRFEDVADSE